MFKKIVNNGVCHQGSLDPLCYKKRHSKTALYFPFLKTKPGISRIQGCCASVPIQICLSSSAVCWDIRVSPRPLLEFIIQGLSSSWKKMEQPQEATIILLSILQPYTAHLWPSPDNVPTAAARGTPSLPAYSHILHDHPPKFRYQWFKESCCKRPPVSLKQAPKLPDKGRDLPVTDFNFCLKANFWISLQKHTLKKKHSQIQKINNINL